MLMNLNYYIQFQVVFIVMHESTNSLQNEINREIAFCYNLLRYYEGIIVFGQL
jgi:hypothetical protein